MLNKFFLILLLSFSIFLTLPAFAQNPDSLIWVPVYSEDFSTDVFESGDWTRSDASVWVDTINGWLHIGQNGGVYSDHAEKAIILALPIVVETRMKLVSGGRNYRLPAFHLFYGPSYSDAFITYLYSGPVYGWRFYGWTGLDTMAPESENVWRTVRAIIRPDSGELLAKADTDTAFTSITTRSWSIPDTIVRVGFFQHWDAICEMDYITIEKAGSAVSSISGTVSDSLGGLLGVTVDLFDNTGSLVQFAHTDPSGFFFFDSLNPGDYTVSIVTPLGYVADFESRLITITPNADSVVNFMLHRLEITSSQRSMGYWKHQVNVYLSGKGSAQESLANMSKYMSRIRTHFNDNLANPVTIFQVPQPATQKDSLEALQKLLTVNKDGTMNDRAKQQLIALMLNVVSSKLHQTTAVSQDGATASQAVTYCNQLIIDSDPTNDEIAKDIADNINNGLLISAGLIPTTTPIIMYKYKSGSEGDSEGDLIEASDVPKSFGLLQNYPNPFNMSTKIEFGLRNPGFVSLNIYDVLGRKVRTLVSQDLPSGYKSVVWDGKDDSGKDVASGTYFYKIKTKNFSETKKLVLLK